MATYKHLTEVEPGRPASGDVPARGPVYRWALTPSPFKLEGPQTLYESFEESCREHADRPCIGYRPVDAATGSAGAFAFMTYRETQSKVAAFAAALRAAGLARGERVAIFGANCCEWMIAMQVRARGARRACQLSSRTLRAARPRAGARPTGDGSARAREACCVR